MGRANWAKKEGERDAVIASVGRRLPSHIRSFSGEGRWIMGQERRVYSRLEVVGQLHGQIVGVNVPLVILDLSTGGFSIESSVAFPLAAKYRFRFTATKGETVLVEAVVAYCRPSAPRAGWTGHITGFSFLLDGAVHTQRAIEALLNAVTVKAPAEV